MANASELDKVRKVLDYVPSRQMKRWPARPYLDALNRRLHREVLVERPVSVKPARDEAVMVVAAEDWEAAQRARERQVLQEAELEQARDEIDAVQARSSELEREIEEMRRRLEDLQAEREEKRKVAVQLVGVRRQAPAPAAWEAPEQASEEAAAEPEGFEPVAPEPEAAAEPLPTPEELAAAGWQVLPGEPGEEAEVEARRRATEAELQATDDAIARVESEIQRIERELQELADKEQALQEAPEPAVYRYKDYTLFHRRVGDDRRERDFYFFSKTQPEDAEAAPLPEGFEVAVNARTGMPYLRKATATQDTPAEAAPAAPRRKAPSKKASGKRKTPRKRAKA